MRRIDTATRAVDLYGPGKPGFKDGNLALGVSPTDLNAAWFNEMQEELANAIEDRGIALVPGNRTQLTAAMMGRMINLTAMTTSGVWTRSPGTKSLIVHGVGGGGAGGGAPYPFPGNCSVGGGGGSGGWGMGRMLNPPPTVGVSIGAGGGSQLGNAGVQGGITNFGGIIAFNGGGGGSVAVAANTVNNIAAGGSGTGFGTGNNLFGCAASPGVNGLALTGFAISGLGASSPYGSGGTNTTSGNGTIGTGYGSGGGGGASLTPYDAYAGGAGCPGILLIYEFG